MLLYRGNTNVLDYDLRRFDVDERRKPKKPVEETEVDEIYTNPNSSSARRGSWFLVLFVAIGFICFFTFHISNKVGLANVETETGDIINRINEAKKENTRLLTTLEELATPSNVEEYANENDLIKEQFSQVTYVHVNIEKSVEVADIGENDFLERFNDWFNNQMEFFGFN